DRHLDDPRRDPGPGPARRRRRRPRAEGARSQGREAGCLGRRRNAEAAHPRREDLGRLVEEDAAGKAVLRLAYGVAQGSGPRRVTEPSQGAVARFCATVDRLNNFMGRVWGLTILAVTFAV